MAEVEGGGRAGERARSDVTVLVVDDEPEIRELCRVNLEFSGYRVLEAGNGADALTLIEHDRPDFVFLDLMMPDIDGWQVLAGLRSNPATAETPVVLLTALGGEDDQIRGWESGIFDYIVKPFNPLRLTEWVEQALEEADPEFIRRRRERMLEQLRFLQKMR